MSAGLPEPDQHHDENDQDDQEYDSHHEVDPPLGGPVALAGGRRPLGRGRRLPADHLPAPTRLSPYWASDMSGAYLTASW